MKLKKLYTTHKKVLLIAAGLAVVVALFSFAVVKQVQAERADNIRSAQTAAARDAQFYALQKQVTELQAADKASQARIAAGCQYLTALHTAKATKALVSAPAVMQCQ